MECSFLPIGSLSFHLSNFSRRSMGNIDGGSDGQREGCCGRKTHSARRRECQGPCASTKTADVASAKEATMGEYLGLFCYQRRFGEPVPGQASSISRCAGVGHSFFSSLHSSDTGRACVLWFSRSLYLFDPCRLGFFLAYCVKGSNRSNFPWIRPAAKVAEVENCIISTWSAQTFFFGIKHPSRQCSASRVWDYLLHFHSLPHRVPVFQVPSVVKNIGNVKRKFHDVIGGMRCGGSKRWLRFFSGKRAVRDVHSEEPGDWEVEQFADALVLRRAGSLATAGVGAS